MRTYYVTVWFDGNYIAPYLIDLTESEKANVITFKEKLNLKNWPSAVIIAWSLIEKF